MSDAHLDFMDWLDANQPFNEDQLAKEEYDHYLNEVFKQELAMLLVKQWTERAVPRICHQYCPYCRHQETTMDGRPRQCPNDYSHGAMNVYETQKEEEF